MGQAFNVRCRKCGHEFEYNSGGGFFCHLLHCNKCGKEKWINFSDIPAIHARYVRGLPGPCCVASGAGDAEIQADESIVPMDEKSYKKSVESAAGHCSCGGAFRFNTRPRCPRCRSFQLDGLDGPALLYD